MKLPVSGLVLFLSLSFLIACNTPQNNQTDEIEYPPEEGSGFIPGPEWEKFNRTYFAAQLMDGAFATVENCWTQQVDGIDMGRGSEDEPWFLSFGGHHSYSYDIYGGRVDGDTLWMTCVAMDGTAVSYDTIEFKHYKVRDHVMAIEADNGEPSYMIEVGYTNLYQHVECLDEETVDRDLDGYGEEEIEPAFTKDEMRDYIVDVLAAIDYGSSGDENYIPPDGVLLVKPGPGIYTQKEALNSMADINALPVFRDDNYVSLFLGISENYDSDKGGGSIIEIDFPFDICMPPGPGLYIEYIDDMGYGYTKARAYVVVENTMLEEYYTHLSMIFGYWENKPKLFKLDITGCGN